MDKILLITVERKDILGAPDSGCL